MAPRRKAPASASPKVAHPRPQRAIAIPVPVPFPQVTAPTPAAAVKLESHSNTSTPAISLPPLSHIPRYHPEMNPLAAMGPHLMREDIGEMAVNWGKMVRSGDIEDQDTKWISAEVLHHYVLDYMKKHGWSRTAEAFLQESGLGSAADEGPPIDVPDGLLYEWWEVFWASIKYRNMPPHGIDPRPAFPPIDARNLPGPGRNYGAGSSSALPKCEVASPFVLHPRPS